MKIPPVKGTRDFYPNVMAVRNFIIDGWKSASIRNGYQEYDGPLFEYLDMYRVKSGDEIVEQLFHLTDRGGRELAVRPEITPSLARMVNQRINSLPRPVKWFSVPRLCRAERPQKGRLREFFQWNIDIIGVDDLLADAEVIFTAVDYLRSLGLTSGDVAVRISSRSMLAAVLSSAGVENAQLDSVYAVLDKRSKLSEEAFSEILSGVVSDPQLRSRICELMSAGSLDDLEDYAAGCEESAAAIRELRDLFDILEKMGVGEFCRFDIGIVRGLAYYTGIVFEIYDAADELRAIGGGGRYDNLLRQFGGPDVPATGFGMGDCVLEILLREKGLLEESVPGMGLDYYVVYPDREYLPEVLKTVSSLRKAGFSCNFSYKTPGLGKQFKHAAAQGAARCVVIGEEVKDGKLSVKDMATGEQVLVDKDGLLD